ncbi:polyamine ABC transporter permease [Mycoplasmopsis agassizii]|uniref:Polyamine ABC transporter permease n=1 Tax=Mycoplasmopsis agassizii TaxID=33922 RepID=A0A269TJE2_9BACT|nr:ABC transporter permease subunit [Mycoplasmopsis agassizii]PAK21146.1 polyamine ABC transporter permease [Mycoplasmopsis agassizii]
MLLKTKKFLIEKLDLNIRLSLVIPFLIFAIIFIVIPLIFIFVKAFTPISEVVDGEVVVNDNYNLINENLWNIIGRSVWTGLVAAILSLMVALPYSYFIARSNNSIFRVAGLSLIISPMFILTLVRVLALRGVSTAISGNEALLNNEIFLIIGMIYVYLPFMIIPLYTVFRDMPKNIINSSEDLGYNLFMTFIKVVLPYSIKAILSGFVLVFLLSATSVGISHKLLPNASQTQLVGNLIDTFAVPANIFKVASVSNVVIITLALMTLAYLLIYFIPRLIMKLKGFKNV